MSELIHAIDKAERIAKLIEDGRSDDADREFFDSDWHGVLVQSLNAQQPMHLNNPPYRLLYGLLQALAQLAPNPRGPADPEKIKSYCQDIRGLSSGGGTADTPPQKAGWWSCADLAEKHGVTRNNLSKRLGRWRKQNGQGWMAVQGADRTHRGPTFLYQPDAVGPVIDDMLGR